MYKKQSSLLCSNIKMNGIACISPLLQWKSFLIYQFLPHGLFALFVSNCEMKGVFLRHMPLQKHKSKILLNLKISWISTSKFRSFLGKGYVNGKIGKYCKPVLNSNLNLTQLATATNWCRCFLEYFWTFLNIFEYIQFRKTVKRGFMVAWKFAILCNLSTASVMSPSSALNLTHYLLVTPMNS